MVQLLRRLVVLAIASAVLIVLGVSPAWAAPAVSVSPSTNLVQGQTVTVRGSGLPPNESEAVLQCVSGGNDVFSFCDIGGFVSTTTDSNGSFSTSFTVRRILETSQGRVDCASAPGRCIVAVSPFDTNYVASTPLSFDPNGPLPVLLDITVTDISAVVKDNKGIVSGTVTCTAPAFVDIEGRLRQVVHRFFIDAPFEAGVECDGSTQFAVPFEGANGVIKKGSAEVVLNAFGSSADGDDIFQLDTTIQIRSK